MATATTQAQELITCDLCIKPVQQFCNSCQVSLCEDCINKHVKSLKSMKHDIVPFTKRTVQLVFPQCTSHSHQRCEVHCRQCDIPVCIKCLTGPKHKGHEFHDMADIIATKKENIKKETEEIEANIPKYTAQDKGTENKISKFMAHYADLQKQTNDNRIQWHLEVDNIFNKMESLIQSLRDHHITTLKSCQSKLRSQNSSMNRSIQENKEILKSYKVSDVNNYQSKLKEFRNIPQIPDLPLPSLQTNTVQGRELSIELGECKATLTQTSLSSLTDDVSFLSFKELLEEAEVIANIPTNVTNLFKVACVGSDKAWVSGTDKMITCVDIHGAVQDTVTSTFKTFPIDITVTRQGELIYSDGNNRTVNIVRDGKTETLITTPRGWYPSGLCCTRSGDILVSMGTTDKSHRKIVHYQGQRVTQEIDKDEHGDPIYQGGIHIVFVVENNNGDIVASDRNARTVVVVDRTGKVRFRYNNKPPGGKESFYPTQIVTDSMGHIIVVDEFNDCLHILDQNGQFLRCVDNCGLKHIIGLSVDSEGRLWVGLYNSGEVKVIQYMK
ncbi:E3 ubiquitin-protein ligase Midline-1-like [Saccostrea echinata]|uniref:E3 ubiquitin-protein ligase Midline-1-like n=1 Tax=Saccostrea echinata TaxID=191078 RepID=UPI002A809D13|nr:E3 ubiquitin-protein ligase Midline-1-like [Saccostrea echinata]